MSITVLAPVPGFEGFYSVSTDGRVFSHPRVDARGHKRNAKWLKLIPDGDGYLRAHLCVNGVRRKWPVHRLVAMAWIPNPEELPMVNHIDGVKTNNDYQNLEWCTAEHNFRHALETGLMPKLERNSIGQFEAIDNGNL